MKKAAIQDYLVLDVETGGLPKGEDQAVIDVALTEVALVYVNSNLEIVDKYSSLVKPYYDGARYEAEAAAISHITKDDCIKEGQPIEKVVEDFIEFIRFNCKSGAKPVMVGHNLRNFDSYWIENMFTWAGQDVYKHVQTRLIDTLEEAWKITPTNEDYTLGTMCRGFGIELVDAHRALPDTVANANLFIQMMRNLRGEDSEEAGGSIEHERLRDSGEFKF